MEIVTANQFPILLAFFFAGVIGTALIFRKPAHSRAWKLADLVWVVLGAFGAIAAVLAGVYKADSSRIERQIEIAYAATAAFDRDAARFRLRNCEGQPTANILILCEKVEFLSASTATNSELPLFIAVTSKAAPLQGLNFFGQKDDMHDMMDAADTFDPAAFLAFETDDDATRAATRALRATQPEIAADFQILGRAYTDLIDEVAQLKTEWEVLQANSGILFFQIIALCLVAFAAPFRLGKSLAELR